MFTIGEVIVFLWVGAIILPPIIEWLAYRK
ncbi:hypothetical protein vBVpaMR16F_159 [Vibrio phage vB_VpaM_R16F]|nr:hypothetical protein vBVpaMR16F_159 [Vibrio phage vB_VpaM_R16F]